MVTFKEVRDDSSEPLDLAKEVERLRLQVHMAEAGAFLPQEDTATSSSDVIASSFTSPEDFQIREDTVTYPNGDVYKGELLGPIRHGTGDHLCSSGDHYIGGWKYDKRDGNGRLVLANGVQYEGQWRDDKANGTGTCVYEDGAVYKGDWQDDQRCGWGTHAFNSGAQYEGEWADDTMHGNGVMCFEDGSVFEGQWEGGQRVKGKHSAADGSWEYAGDWKDETQHGTGVLYRHGLFKYMGGWKEGLQDGQGQCFYADGGKYDGQWAAGKRQGKGVFSFQAYKYEGDWAEDRQEGQGRCVTDAGDRYVGTFHNGLRHGHGRCVYADGTQYEGNWVADKRDGEGVCLYANGDKYKGTWMTDRRHGHGVCRFADGTRFRGEWEDDGWVQSSACAGTSRIVGPGLSRGTAGETSTFVIQARDEDNNRRLEGGDEFVAALYSAKDVVVCDVEDAGDGTYTVQYTPRIAGVYELHITVSNEHVAASPYPVRIEPGTAVVRGTTVIGEGRRSTIVGKPSSFSILLHDVAGNRCSGAAALKAVPITAELEDPHGQKIAAITIQFDEIDASYLCCYTASEPGLHRLHLLSNDVQIPGSPFSLEATLLGAADVESEEVIDLVTTTSSPSTTHAATPKDEYARWEARARQAYAADGDEAGWDSDGEGKKEHRSEEDAYIRAHPDVPVVENLEDIWQVSKLQAERKRKEEKAKAERLKGLQERLGAAFGAAEPPKPEEVQAALRQILRKEAADKPAELAMPNQHVNDDGQQSTNKMKTEKVGRKERLRAALSNLDDLDGFP